MLFSLNFLQQKISPRPKTVQKGEAIASDGISLLYILSDSCKKCGKSKWILLEVLRCLNYTPVRLSAAWLNPILHCCRVFWTFVVFYTLMYWLTGTGASSSGKFQIIVAIGLELILLRGRFSQNLFKACFSCCCYISAKSSSNGCRSCYFSALQHFLAPLKCSVILFFKNYSQHCTLQVRIVLFCFFSLSFY